MTAPLTITYHQAVKAGACRGSLDRMRDSDIIGGDWGTFGRDTPIPLTAVWDVLGEADMWWALWAADKRTSRLLASDFAAHVHRFFDCVRPDDTRPRDAISVARAWDAAEAAAWDAAGAAAGAAAGDAAWDAARYLERQWQIDHLRAVLNGERAAGEVEITMHTPTDAEVTA